MDESMSEMILHVQGAERLGGHSRGVQEVSKAGLEQWNVSPSVGQNKRGFKVPSKPEHSVIW